MNILRVVGIGGAIRTGSTSELALAACLDATARLGARTTLFSGDALDLPLYRPGVTPPKARALLDSIRAADGVILCTPAYHGAMSGVLKNALDYVEELRLDDRPYFDGRAVGVAVCAFGAQAIGTTLVSLRTVVHALRGWPTPLALGLTATPETFDAQGRPASPELQGQVDMLAHQIVTFAQTMRTTAPPAS